MPLSPPELNELDGHGNDVYLELQTNEHKLSEKEFVVINDIRFLYSLAKKCTSFPSYSSEQAYDSVFDGGHVHIFDNGKYYNRWLNMLRVGLVKGGSRKGTSSHESDVEQFEIALKGWGGILFGMRKKGTWFQVEAHAFTTGFSDQLMHLSDYGKHKFSGEKQVGSRGLSPYSEKKNSELVIPSNVARQALKLD